MSKMQEIAMSSTNLTYILTLRCIDSPGIVAKVTTCLYEHQASVTEAAQYGDPITKQFFARFVFAAIDPQSIQSMYKNLAEVAKEFNMTWNLVATDKSMKVMLMVSQYGHCLNDLLHRWRTGSLPIDIVGVVSNHDDMRKLVEWHDIPYHYLPIASGTKANQEAQVMELVDNLEVELVVLARYMQILSAEMCHKLANRCINIHHSFLPSFIGAKPYHAAHKRGVKLIGATAHYVTAHLDEGPIIEQDIRRVNHFYTAEQLVETGRDIEATVLARAVRWHAEHRIHVDDNKTVVFGHL